MNTLRIRTPARSKSLNLQQFEDRCTPAAIAYAAATDTLMITGADNDQVQIGTVMDVPGGSINVKVNSVEVFVSAPMSQPVKNLVVRFDGVDHGELYLNPSVQLPGNLFIRGARLNQFVSIQSDIGGRIAYQAVGKATDEIRIDQNVHIVGDVQANLGAGDNTLRLQGGFIAGHLIVNGGKDSDRVELAANADFTVGQAVRMNLGAGTNTVEGMASHVFGIGKNLSYFGGPGVDSFSLVNTDLHLVGTAKFLLGNAPIEKSNYVYLGKALVSNGIIVIGGAGSDIVRTFDDLNLNGNLTALVGNGTNSLTMDGFAASHNTIGGGLIYVGGTGQDRVSIDGSLFGRNSKIALGDSPENSQFVHLGNNDPQGVRFQQNLSVIGGNRNDEFSFSDLLVEKSLTVQGRGGNDDISLDDTIVGEQTTIDLGAGDDTLAVETLTGFGLDGLSTFIGKFRVFGRDGADSVNLSDDANPATSIGFNSPVALIGGAGSDTLHNHMGNAFLSLSNFEDFEIGDTLP